MNSTVLERHETTTPQHSNVLADRSLWAGALVGALRKLDPRTLWRNPVMFTVEATSTMALALWVAHLGHESAATDVFAGTTIAWLFATVVFANFAESIAEGRGKAQADALRRTRHETTAHVRRDGREVELPSSDLRVDDVCVVRAGEVIPCDGEIIEGIATVDESAITGESAPVIRESGGDRSSVTGGTRVLSDEIVVRVAANPGETFLDRMIAMVEGASRRKTPNEVALDLLLVGLTLVFVIAIATLQPFASFSNDPQSVVVLVALFVCLIPTTIGALLSAIGIAGMDRLVQHNVMATSGRAVEAAGDCTTLLLDKTGTITYGNRRASALFPMPGVAEGELAGAVALASLADETPEGRSIVEYVAEHHGYAPSEPDGAQWVAFSAQTRMSGVDLADAQLRKGAASAVAAWVLERGGRVDPALDERVGFVAAAGGTPLAVADSERVLGVVYLKDVVKPGIAERFAELRRMGIRTVMVTGDNPTTAAAIAREAGVDDFLAEATPEDKLAYIRAEQLGGNMVAMTGDGTNDAPALAVADVGVAMNSGTQAAKEAGNMVDLDSDPTKLLDVVAIGKQLLITRGALTTFSIANDVAKFFAIVPAMFVGAYPGLSALNVMRLGNPHSAILAAVIFNALVIVALIPLALRGVRVRAMDATRMLRRNLLVYGAGGVVVPFVAIKAIDVVLVTLGVH